MANEKTKGGMTLLGAGTSFEGEIDIPHEFSVHGTFTGKIVCKGQVIVGSKGIIKADINAKTAIISGNMEGNLTCSGTVELEENAVLVGNISAKELIINKGATFHGNSSMGSNNIAISEKPE